LPKVQPISKQLLQKMNVPNCLHFDLHQLEKVIMNKIRVIKNQKGFSIAEVLVAFGLMSILGIISLQIMQDSFNASSLAEAKNDEIEMSRQLQLTLIYKPNCDKNLQGKLINDVNYHDIINFLDSTNKEILTRGQVIGNRSLKVADIEYYVKPADFAAFNAYKASPPPGEPTYLMDAYVKVTTEKLKTQLGGKNLVADIPIKVKVDATSKVVECFTSVDSTNETAMQSFCTQIGGVFNTVTKECDFNTVGCDTSNPDKLVPAKCVDEKVAKSLKDYSALVDAKLAEMEKRLVASVPTATPVVVAAATPAPTPDPYALPFSPTKPGPGCIGDGCSASDYGPCSGTNCQTNGGSCTGFVCQTGVKTGTVKWDGKNMYTPSNPGPGCKGDGCVAHDYGVCEGTNCQTNGGSCKGFVCQTGIN
jgi:hypothetical protein